MWEPEPGWQRLSGGMGASTVGVWRNGDRVAKRIEAPLRGDPADLSDPAHFAWWRRAAEVAACGLVRSEEHTSELQSLMRISYAVFCLKKTKYLSTKSYMTRALS